MLVYFWLWSPSIVLSAIAAAVEMWLAVRMVLAADVKAPIVAKMPTFRTRIAIRSSIEPLAVLGAEHRREPARAAVRMADDGSGGHETSVTL